VTALVADRLGKRYGSTVALDEVSFRIGAGQLVAVLGPNGSGKTTLVELLAGFSAPTGGTVRVLGADPRRGGPAWRARIGLVPQETSLDLRLTVAEVLRAFAAAYPRALPVGDVLALIDLAAEAGTRIGALSGGQRRRVDLGLGLIGRPEVLFLDEPTTGLDPRARRRVWACVRDLTAGDTAVVLTTHYLDEAQQLADRVLVLAGGRLAADATPDELRAHAAAPTIRLPVPPAAAADLPPAFRGHLDRDELVLRSADVGADLAGLLGWAARAGVDLSGLQVGPPSLEEAYLVLTGQTDPLRTERRGEPSHA
jgi:ABC-2 type transport system ATP-binding protein